MNWMKSCSKFSLINRTDKDIDIEIFFRISYIECIPFMMDKE